jgi:hypothetical protein
MGTNISPKITTANNLLYLGAKRYMKTAMIANRMLGIHEAIKGLKVPPIANCDENCIKTM